MDDIEHLRQFTRRQIVTVTVAVLIATVNHVSCTPTAGEFARLRNDVTRDDETLVNESYDTPSSALRPGRCQGHVHFTMHTYV